MVALQTLTAIPVPGNYVKEEKDLGRSMAFYPLAGLLIGLLTLAVFRLSSLIFTPALSLILAFVANILFTGGLHLDGFGDMCDGFYAGKDKKGILAIMKDSHVGTMAVLGIFCLLILKLALWFSLLQKNILEESLLIIPSVSRWVMSVAAGIFPYARAEGGTAKPFVENVRPREILLSSFLMFAVSFGILRLPGILIPVSTLAAALLFMQWVKRRIGGITGDVLGGLNEISEVSALLILAAFPWPKTL